MNDSSADNGHNVSAIRYDFNSLGYDYLATPYSDPDPRVRYLRFVAAELWTKYLLEHGIHVYSPIVHCHALATNLQLSTDAAFWHSYNMTMLQSASRVRVLTLPGYHISKGVNSELNEADRLNKEVVWDEPAELRRLAAGIFGADRIL